MVLTFVLIDIYRQVFFKVEEMTRYECCLGGTYHIPKQDQANIHIYVKRRETHLGILVSTQDSANSIPV